MLCQSKQSLFELPICVTPPVEVASAGQQFTCISSEGVVESSNFIIILFFKQTECSLTEMVFSFMVNLMVLICSKNYLI